jgi:hypothetical protein
MWSGHVTVAAAGWTCFSWWKGSGRDLNFYLVLVETLFASMKVKPGAV